VSALTLRQAAVADIPAMSRIRIAVKENALSDPARRGHGEQRRGPVSAAKGGLAGAPGSLS